jgi:tape measure domain-containing protein
MAVDDGSISIEVVPDGDGFQLKLNKVLAKVAGSVEVKPNLSGFATETKQALKKVNLSADVKLTPTFSKTAINKAISQIKGSAGTIDIKINPTFTKISAATLKKDLKAQLNTVTKNGAVVDAPIKIKLELDKPSSASITKVKKQILADFGVLKLPATAIASKATLSQIVSPVGKDQNSNTKSSISNLVALERAVKGQTGGFLSASRALSGFQIGAGLASTAIIGLTGAFLRLGFESSKQIETASRVIRGFVAQQDGIKDITGATDLFLKKLQEFANVTPFNLSNVLTGAQRLLGAEFKVQDVIPALTKIGDLGAQLGASGVAVERVSTALAKIKGQGKVTQRELRTIFTAFPGFNPFEAIASGVKSLEGLSKGEVLKQISKGAVSADDAIKALLDGMAKFPGAAGAMQRQALTTAGSLETLKDSTQNALRNSITPSLPFLARDMREASRIILEESEGVGSGIADIFRNAGGLISPSLTAGFQLTNDFSQALAQTIPTVTQLLTDFGPTLTETLGVAIKLLPAATNSLSVLLSVISPFTGVIDTFVKTLDLVPSSLISLIAAYKTFNVVSNKFSLFGRGSKAIASELQGAEVATKGFLSRTASGISGLSTQVKKDASSISGAFKNLGVKQLGSDLESINQKIAYTKAQAKGAILNGDSLGAVAARKNIGALGKEFDYVSSQGVTASMRIRGGLEQAKASAVGFSSSIKGAGNSLLSAFGGPAGLAITGLTIGLGVLFDKWQKNKQAVKEYAQEAKLASEAIKLDSVSNTRADFTSNIISELKKLDKTKKDIEGALAGVGNTGLKGNDLEDVFKKNQGDKTGENIVRAFEGGQNISDAVSASAQKIAKEGLTNKALGELANDKKKREKLLKELNKPNQGEGNLGDLFGDTAADKLATYAKQVKKATDQILASSKDAFRANAALAKDLGNKDLEKFFNKQADAVEKNKELPKNIAEQSKAIAQLTTEQAKIDSKAFYAALGLDEKGNPVEANVTQTEAATAALQNLNTAINDAKDAFDGFQVDTVFNNIDPKGLNALSNTFNSTNDPAQFVTQFTLQSGIVDNEENRKKIIEELAGFQEVVRSEYQSMIDELKGKLPNIADVFAEKTDFSQGGQGADVIIKNLEAQANQIKTFSENYIKVAQQSGTDVAIFLAKQGPELGGKALAEVANNPALAQGFRTGMDNVKSESAKYISQLPAGVKAELESKYGPLGFELAPNFNFTPPDQARIDEIATQLKTTEDAIVAAKNKIVKPAQFGRFGVEDQGALSNTKEISDLEAKKAELIAQQEALNTAIFTNLTSQAATTATAINTTFAQADIAGAIKPQIDAVSVELANIPTKIQETFNSNFVAQNLLLSTGGSIGLGFVNGINNGLITGVELFRQIWISSFESLGSQIGASFTLGFQNGLIGIKDAILSPFRATVAPLNSYFVALASAGKAIGLNVAFTPIPQFHDGGFAGDPKAQKHNGVFKQDEYLAVLKKGESVLNPTATNNVGKQTIDALNKGRIGDGLGVIGEQASSYSSAADRQVIADAKANYFKNALVGPSQNILQKMADAIVTKFADASLKYLDNIDSKISSNVGDVPGVITSGSVVEQLLAAKGKPGSFKTLIKIMKGSGLPFGVSSTVRPGSITASGNLSLHSAARAVDFVGTAKQMLAMSKWWTQYAPYLAELIHTPMGFGIKNGKKMQYPANVLKGHYNHGHVALFDGGMVRGSAEGTIATIGERGQSELVLPLGQPDRMAQIINYAIRSGEMSHQGQKAVAQVLPGNTTNRTSRTENKIEVTVVAPVEDAHLQGTIIANRVLAALKGL